MNELFHKISAKISQKMGSPWAFLLALVVIIVWAVSGPLFGFSNTWQLVINTGTTIVTFLMVFLIQNTQNRDAKAMQLKLDELIRAVGKARTKFLDLEDLSDGEIKALDDDFKRLRAAEVSPVIAKIHEQLEDEGRRRNLWPFSKK